MMWHSVTPDAVRGIQKVFLGASVALGVVFTAQTPRIMHEPHHVGVLWGVGLIVFGLLGFAGELLIGRSKRRYRWVAAWVSHTCLTAICAGLAVKSFVNIGTPGGDGAEELIMIMFAVLAWVHRCFVHPNSGDHESRHRESE